jgi:Zn-finger nucleic acid-binding protein
LGEAIDRIVGRVGWEVSMSCPNCKSKLHAHELQGLEIDWCRTCRSVFLDRGEFEKVLYLRRAYPPPAHDPGGEVQSFTGSKTADRALRILFEFVTTFIG